MQDFWLYFYIVVLLLLLKQTPLVLQPCLLLLVYYCILLIQCINSKKTQKHLQYFTLHDDMCSEYNMSMEMNHWVQLVILCFAAIHWFLDNPDRSCISYCPVLSVCLFLCVFMLGQVCDCGHPSWSESEDALQPRASTAKEPADPPRPHGLRHQVHGLLQRELLEEKGYAGSGKQERGNTLIYVCLIWSFHSFFTLVLVRVCHQVTVALWWLRRRALPLAWHWMTQSLMGVYLPLWGEYRHPASPLQNEKDTDDILSPMCDSPLLSLWALKHNSDIIVYVCCCQKISWKDPI